MDSRQYYIPSVRMRVDLIPGLGVPELIVTAIVATIAAAVAGLLYVLRGDLTIGMFIILISVALAVGCLMRDENNLSLVKQVGIILRYFRSTKDYEYEHLDEWGVE